MTATYDKSGFRFLYPQNWKVADEQFDQPPRSVTLESPSGAIWSVDVHPFSVDPLDLTQQVVQAMQQEYSDLEFEEASETIHGQPAVGFNMNFWCLDFVITARTRAFRQGHATYLLLYQAEDRDYDQLEAVFRAITESMLRSVDALGDE
ncbi:MAG: hypothetical protein KDA60_03525 [Planctomycetales bacterium]|nr:hypothetical protein [Planctomycetales bacterium]